MTYKYAGLDAAGDPRVYLNGKVSKDYNSINSNIAVSDLVFHGANLPLYFGALRNDFKWGSWSFSANITFRFKYWFRQNSIGYDALFARWVGHPDYALRWQQPGDELLTNVPALSYPANYQRDDTYLNSDVLVEKGDHIRLQDVHVSFDLAKNRIWRMPVQQMQVFKGDYAGKNFANLFNGLATDEVMLVKAEAAIRKGGAQNVAEGIAVLNELLETRWEPGAYVNYPNNMEQQAALAVVLAERRKELAFRGGIRWSDVKRLQDDPVHHVTLRRKTGGELFTLTPGDKRFAFLIPQEVIQLSNIPQNER